MVQADRVRHLNLVFPRQQFASRQDWEAFAAWLRLQIKVSLALLPQPQKCPLRAQVFGRALGDGFVTEKVAIESLPGCFVTGNLYRPEDGRYAGPRPGILSPHGHWQSGRLHMYDPLGSVVGRCIQFARLGAVVFSYDMIGYNDSCQLPHGEAFPADPHWGLSHLALQTWNSIRALDFLTSLPEVDPARVGVSGASGGGTQTYMLTAVDERPAAAAPICMTSYSMQGGCWCENAPLLRLGASNVEITSLFAPKPLFLGSCTTDWTQNTPEQELPAIRSVYALYGAADRVSGLHVDAQHNYNQQMQESVAGFFARWLHGQAQADPVPHQGIGRLPSLRERMVWWGRRAPKPMPTRVLLRLWQEHVGSGLEPLLRDPAAVRRELVPLLPHVLGVLPARVPWAAEPEPRGLALTVTGETATVAPKGMAALQREEAEACQTVRFFTTYNRAFVAERTNELLAVLKQRPDVRRLQGQGAAGTCCLLAAALAPQITHVEADLDGFDPTSARSWNRQLDLPSIRQIGGLATVFAALSGRAVTLARAPATAIELAARYSG